MSPVFSLAVTAKNQTKPTFDQVVSDANRVAGAMQTSGGRAAQAMGGASMQTANLAAQLNDIGVMLASGQSPLTLAFQQGTQINQVFAGMTGAQALGALKTAFLSLINPISLVTIGTIAAGAAAFQYFTSLNTDGKTSTEVLKEQNDVLRRVAQNWGEAVPALKAYVDQLDRASEAGDLGEAAKIAQRQIFSEFVPQVEELGLAFDIVRETTAATAEESDRLDRAYDGLVGKMKDGSAGAADFKNLLDLLSASQVGNTETGQMLIAILNQLAPAYNKAAAGAANLAAQTNAALGGPDLGDGFRDRQEAQFQFVREQERINGLTGEQLTLEREIARIQADAERAGTGLSDREALALAEQTLAAEKARADFGAANKAAGGAASDVERERQAVADLIAELEHEQSLIGGSNVEKEIANALREAGAAATDAERARIEELITAIDAQEEAQKALTKGWEEYGKIGQNAVRGVVDIFKDGKVEADEWADLLGKIGEQFLNLAANGLFNMFGGGLGGGGGGLLGGLFGFSEGGGGVVGGAGSYVAGGADDTLFVAKAQKGEPFAFGDAAINGLGGAGGGTTVRIELGEGLRAAIVQESVGTSVQIMQGPVSELTKTVSRMGSRERY